MGSLALLLYPECNEGQLTKLLREQPQIYAFLLLHLAEVVDSSKVRTMAQKLLYLASNIQQVDSYFKLMMWIITEKMNFSMAVDFSQKQIFLELLQTYYLSVQLSESFQADENKQMYRCLVPTFLQLSRYCQEQLNFEQALEYLQAFDSSTPLLSSLSNIGQLKQEAKFDR